MKRGDMRARFGIEGNGCGDCMAAWCCHCCALIQEEKESLLRTGGIDAKTGQQYQAPNGMTYP
jgi:PLAC8 family